MKRPGYLDPSFVPPAPFIYAEIESRTLSLKGTVAFLIDTGSSVTTIMDRDRERLGINWNHIESTNRLLAGIGGTVDTRIIRHAALSFKTETEKIVQEKLSIHVAKHDLTRQDRRGIERVLQLPSLLGRDVIERYRLVYDKSRRLVFLDTDPVKGTTNVERVQKKMTARLEGKKFDRLHPGFRYNEEKHEASRYLLGETKRQRNIGKETPVIDREFRRIAQKNLRRDHELLEKLAKI